MQQQRLEGRNTSRTTAEQQQRKKKKQEYNERKNGDSNPAQFCSTRMPVATSIDKAEPPCQLVVFPTSRAPPQPLISGRPSVSTSHIQLRSSGTESLDDLNLHIKYGDVADLERLDQRAGCLFTSSPERPGCRRPA